MTTRPAPGEPTVEKPIVEIWDLPARAIRRTLAFSSPVRSLAFSPDGRLLTTFEDRGGIRLVEWATDHTLTNLQVPPGSRLTYAGVLEFTSDGARLVIGEAYGPIRILNWQTGSVATITNLIQPGDGAVALTCSPNSDLFAAAFGGFARLWDAGSGEHRGQLSGYRSWVKRLAFTPDGQRLVAACADRTIRVWSVVDPAELQSVQGHASEGKALAATMAVELSPGVSVGFGTIRIMAGIPLSLVRTGYQIRDMFLPGGVPVYPCTITRVLRPD